MIVLRGLGRDINNPYHAYGIIVTHGIGRHWRQAEGSTWIYSGEIPIALDVVATCFFDRFTLYEAVYGTLATQRYMGDLALDKNLGRIAIPAKYYGKLRYESYSGRLSKA